MGKLGILVLVHRHFKAKLLTQEQTYGPGIETCRIALHPTLSPDAMRHLKGVYIPQKLSGAPTRAALDAMMVRSKNDTYDYDIAELLERDFKKPAAAGPL